MQHIYISISISLFQIILTNGVTNFDCRSDTCYDAELLCVDDIDCMIDCGMNGGCDNAHVECPSNAKCEVLCDGSSACVRLTVNAKLSTELSLTCSDYSVSCKLIDFYCPDAGQCIIIAHNVNYNVFSSDNCADCGLIINAVNGLGAVTLLPDASITGNVFINCGPIYQYSCNVQLIDPYKRCISGDSICGLQTSAPTSNPLTMNPSKTPSKIPTTAPTFIPTIYPSKAPSKIPTTTPSRHPISSPTEVPLINPIAKPTKSPSKNPTTPPTHKPTNHPLLPGSATGSPTGSPTNPSISPTNLPSVAPIYITTISPTNIPSASSVHISSVSTNNPSVTPTSAPTKIPTTSPSLSKKSSAEIVDITTTFVDLPTEHVHNESASVNAVMITKLYIFVALVVLVCCLTVLICKLKHKKKDANIVRHPSNFPMTNNPLGKTHSAMQKRAPSCPSIPEMQYDAHSHSLQKAASKFEGLRKKKSFSDVLIEDDTVDPVLPTVSPRMMYSVPTESSVDCVDLMDRLEMAQTKGNEPDILLNNDDNAKHRRVLTNVTDATIYRQEGMEHKEQTPDIVLPMNSKTAKETKRDSRNYNRLESPRDYDDMDPDELSNSYENITKGIVNLVALPENVEATKGALDSDLTRR